MSHMEHAEVLDIRPLSDPDVVDIASDHGVEPDAAMGTHDDIADYDSSLFDKARLGDGRLDALKASNHERHNRGSERPPARACLKGLIDSLFDPPVDCPYVSAIDHSKTHETGSPNGQARLD
ncbi:MAG: hypothetical protein NTAFB01_02340 [Nitrospira sp.]